MGSQGHGNGNFRSPATWEKLVSGLFLGVPYFRIYENYLKKKRAGIFCKNSAGLNYTLVFIDLNNLCTNIVRLPLVTRISLWPLLIPIHVSLKRPRKKSQLPRLRLSGDLSTGSKTSKSTDSTTQQKRPCSKRPGKWTKDSSVDRANSSSKVYLISIIFLKTQWTSITNVEEKFFTGTKINYGQCKLAKNYED